MRIWAFEDNRAIPSDLVREQDFILRVRRMQRVGTPTLVLNFVLTAVEHLVKNPTVLETVQKKLQEFATVTSGNYAEMSNGDAFIAWEKTGNTDHLAAQIIEAIFPDHKADTSRFLLSYKMPEDYTRLRERANHYVEVVRAASTVEALNPDKETDPVQGHLTARSVDRIEQVLGEIDVRRYGRTQNIYQYVDGAWKIFGEEYFISFEDLRRERFPKLDFGASEHFFQALCGILDQRLLSMMPAYYETISGRMINLNFSISTIASPQFAQLVRRVPREKRNLIGFELNRGDLLQDFALTLSAIDVLKREGFRIALDGITPDMVNFVNLAAFPVDAIKINVSKDRVLQLTEPDIHKGLKTLPPEKLIFFRCDNEHALSIGTSLGVTAFQGWLIDDIVGKQKI